MKTLHKDSVGEALELLSEIRDMERHDSEDYRRLRRAIAARRRRRWLAFAAAVVLPVAGGILLFDADRGRDIDSLVAYTTPTLEFSRGERVTLDDFKHGMVIEESAEAVIRLDAEGVIRIEKKDDTKAPVYSTLHVARGAPVCEIELEDGTMVSLNSGSKLRFPAVFPSGERRVEVEGEAYFAVARREGSPFIVETPGMYIEVLGTEFNLSAYSDEAVATTTLFSGSLIVGANGYRTLLTPGRQACIDRLTGTVTVADATGYAADWRSGLIDMEKRTLEEIIRILGRIYDVEISFDDDRPRGIVYRGSIPRYERLTDVLNIIESGSPVEFRTHGDTIRVKYKS